MACYTTAVISFSEQSGIVFPLVCLDRLAQARANRVVAVEIKGTLPVS